MPKMRTIEQAAQWFAENDPGTAINKTSLRRLVVTGQIPSRRIGVKYLIDLDDVTAFFKAN